MKLNHSKKNHRFTCIFLILMFFGFTACGSDDQKATCDDSVPLLSLPISAELQNQSWIDNVYVAEAYQDKVGTPAGSTHTGVHLSPLNGSSELTYIAVASGTVTGIQEILSAGTHNVNVLFETQSGITVVYQFETQAASESALIAQRSKIFVSEGQSLNEGDRIGTLHDEDGTSAVINPILHLGVIDCENNLVCPTGHFTHSTLATLNSILKRDQPTWELCYGD